MSRWCVNCQRHAKHGGQVGECGGPVCTRCPWAGCQCTHTDGCDRGFIEEDPDDAASMAQVRKCPNCQGWAESLAMVPHEKPLRVVS